MDGQSPDWTTYWVRAGSTLTSTAATQPGLSYGPLPPPPLGYLPPSPTRPKHWGPRGGLRCSPTGSNEDSWGGDPESGAGSTSRPPSFALILRSRAIPVQSSPPPVTPGTPVTAAASHPQPLSHPKPLWSPTPGDSLCAVCQQTPHTCRGGGRGHKYFPSPLHH